MPPQVAAETFPLALGALVLLIILSGGNGGGLLWLALIILLVCQMNSVIGGRFEFESRSSCDKFCAQISSATFHLGSKAEDDM